jgi:hypothetical protein
VAIVRIEVTEERIAYITVERISEPRKTLAVTKLLVIANVVPSLLILFILKVKRSSETSVLTTATRRHFLEDGILHSRRRENRKPYIVLTGWAL